MATYRKVKRETIRFVDYYSYRHEIEAGYLKPPGDPEFSAGTELSDIGLSRNFRKGLAQAANDWMGTELGAPWQDVSVPQMGAATTIGELIVLFCACSQTAVPDEEPT